MKILTAIMTFVICVALTSFCYGQKQGNNPHQQRMNQVIQQHQQLRHQHQLIPHHQFQHQHRYQLRYYYVPAYPSFYYYNLNPYPNYYQPYYFGYGFGIIIR